MKKLFMMMALLALPFAMQAQTKFHDVEANEAKGAVKSITTMAKGEHKVINFTKDGKMQQEGMSEVKYDAKGYIQSFKLENKGMIIPVTYKWANGRVTKVTMTVMGQETLTTTTYNEKGEVVSMTTSMGGQNMTVTCSDYKYDARGNWISRKINLMGQEVETTRTIEYYE